MSPVPLPTASTSTPASASKDDDDDDALQQRLDNLVARLTTAAIDSDDNNDALATTADIIRSSTATLTSVPKPLKFLRQHYPALQRQSPQRPHFYNDLLSVLAMTVAAAETACLRYKLLGEPSTPVTHWGHEYVRTLAAQIPMWQPAADDALGELVDLVLPILSPPEACDLCIELSTLDKLPPLATAATYPRVCLYLLACANYAPEPENTNIRATAHQIYERFGDAAQAQRVRALLDRRGTSSAPNSAHYLRVARDLDIAAAKTPEDIYKSSDSARQNLASTFVNAFLNCGFADDALVAPYLARNKSHGLLSATAAVGLLYLYDVDGGLAALDKYMYSSDTHTRAGALLGIGVLSGGRVRDECDAPLALLSEHVESDTDALRVSAILGLGIAYAGTQRADITELLTPVVADAATATETAAVAALALGLVHVSSADAELTAVLLQAVADHKDDAHPLARLLPLGLGLLYLQRGGVAVEAVSEAASALGGGELAATVLQTCAQLGSGDVLTVQQMLSSSSDIAPLAIALIAGGEDIGHDMSLRLFEHVLQFGAPSQRHAVPLALGALCVSNPRMEAIDSLSKLSHDHDANVAAAAVFSMGLVAAATNNSRVAGLLRQLAEFYADDTGMMFVVRLAQGLVHLGKGMMTLSPYYSDGTLLDSVSAAGLLTVLVLCLGEDGIKQTIQGRYHYLLFVLALAMRPRFLLALDADSGEPVPVPVRVGQAVDTVGQAGQPKTITGFQTHDTPVLLSAGERAEFATDEWRTDAAVLEGAVYVSNTS